MAKSVGKSKIVRDVVVVGIVIVAFWLGIQLIFGTANPFYVVSSGSMVPALNEYDILIVQANEPFESVQLGDIIVFDRPSGTERVIVHRVVSIIDDDPYTLRTKGDANVASMPGIDFPITEDEYLGTVSHVIPQVGLIARILTPPINYILIALILGALIFRQFRKKKPEIGTPATDEIPQDTTYADESASVDETAASTEARQDGPKESTDKEQDGG